MSMHRYLEFEFRKNQKIALAAACTPNSADCERLVSANNNLITYSRTNLSNSIENDYLYNHFNMPALENGIDGPQFHNMLVS